MITVLNPGHAATDGLIAARSRETVVALGLSMLGKCCHSAGDYPLKGVVGDIVPPMDISAKLILMFFFYPLEMSVLFAFSKYATAA